MKSINEGLQIALRGGAVAGLIVVAMSLLGVVGLYLLVRTMTDVDPAKIPFLIVGYGFGASFVALFAQLGGGIYTKAADVGIVTQGALREMIAPGLLATLMPVVVGLIFKQFGVGAEAVAALLMVGTITGIMMALLLNNAGGAWDNAKKYIETGALGGKGSDVHKAAVVGDNIGDPFKDTAGPSLHVVIKLLSTITLVLAPLFI